MFSKKLLLGLPLAMLLVACGKDGNKNPFENAAEAAKDKDLQGKTFESECSVEPIGAIIDGLLTGFDAAGKSTRVQYRFDGANVARTTVLFTDVDCADEALRFEERGEFDINKDKKTKDGGYNLDMKFRGVYVTVADANGIEIAKGRELCGATDWTAGEEREVTAKAEDINCYNAKVPRNDVNIYRVDADVLYLGQSGKDEVGANERPSSLDSRKYTSR